MCKAEVTGSLVPTVAKQIQSVDPVGLRKQRYAPVKEIKMTYFFNLPEGYILSLFVWVFKDVDTSNQWLWSVVVYTIN